MSRKNRKKPQAPSVRKPPKGKNNWARMPDLEGHAKLRQFKDVLATDAMAALREATKQKAPTDDAIVVGPSRIPTAMPEVVNDPSLSEEQRAILEARRAAVYLMTTNSDIARVIGAMIAFRQCYVVAYTELKRRLDEIENKTAMTEDYLIQAAMHASAQKFQEHDLMRGFIETVLPWMAQVIDRHSDQDEKHMEELYREEEAKRRTRLIPIGFKANLEDVEPVMRRDRSLVLMGWSNAVLYVLDQITNATLAAREGQRFTVARFRHEAPKGPSPDLLSVVSPDHWKGCCNHFNDLRRCVGQWILTSLRQPVDLMICDDLAHAHTAGFVGRPPGASAGDAHHCFRRWCTEAGAGFIGAVLLPDEVTHPDTRLPELEQIRSFSDLRPVHVLRDPPVPVDHYRLRVGTSLYWWDVPKGVLDYYTRGRIISPS